MKKLVVPLLFLFPLIADAGQEYSYEIVGQYQRVEPEFSGDSDGWSIGATHYFSAVQLTDVPWAEAAFAGRNSLIRIDYSQSDGDDPANLETSGYSLRGQYIDANNGWFIGGSIGRGDSESESNISTPFSDIFIETDGESDAFSLSVGRYIAETTTLTLGYSSAETDLDTETVTLAVTVICPPLIICAPGPGALVSHSKTESDAETWSLSARHLGALDSWHYALRGGVSYQELDAKHTQISPLPTIGFGPLVPSGSSTSTVKTSDSSWGYGVGTTLYPAENWGFGLDYSRLDGDDTESSSYSASLEWFFNPFFSIAAGYGYSRAESGSITLDTDSYSLQLKGRF